MNLQNLKDQFLDYTPDQKRALILGGCLAGLLSLFLLFLSRGESVEAQPVQVVQSETTPLSSKLLLVHVAGEVKVPGVYSLAQGARVADAIKAAGGAKKGIDTSQVNLARIIVDGEQIYLGKENPIFQSKKSGKPKVFNGIVYINRATAAQFDSLPGIGPIFAKRIVEYRKNNGPFVDIADLQKVEGIGAKTFEKMKSRLSL